MVVAGSTGEAHALDDASSTAAAFAVERMAGAFRCSPAPAFRRPRRRSRRRDARAARASISRSSSRRLTCVRRRKACTAIFSKSPNTAACRSCSTTCRPHGCDVLPETVARLARSRRHRRHQGSARRDASACRRCAELAREDFGVLSGDDPTRAARDAGRCGRHDVGRGERRAAGVSRVVRRGDRRAMRRRARDARALAAAVTSARRRAQSDPGQGRVADARASALGCGCRLPLVRIARRRGCATELRAALASSGILGADGGRDDGCPTYLTEPRLHEENSLLVVVASRTAQRFAAGRLRHFPLAQGDGDHTPAGSRRWRSRRALDPALHHGRPGDAAARRQQPHRESARRADVTGAAGQVD